MGGEGSYDQLYWLYWDFLFFVEMFHQMNLMVWFKYQA